MCVYTEYYCIIYSLILGRKALDRREKEIDAELQKKRRKCADDVARKEGWAVVRTMSHNVPYGIHY